MKIIQNSSTCFNDRKDGKTPKYLIMHYMGLDSFEESLNILTGKTELEASAHYIINEDGTIIQLVDEHKRAWHAGLSYWNGERDMNSASIGIELYNKGIHNKEKPYTAEQISSLIQLSKEIMKRHDIPAKNVIAHSDIAPDRKEDPGELFPWKELAQHGIGIWPEVTKEDIKKAETILGNENKILELLAKIGYAPIGTFKENTPDFKQLITSFQRHFEPEVFENKNEVTTSINTVALMLKLTKQLNMV